MTRWSMRSRMDRSMRFPIRLASKSIAAARRGKSSERRRVLALRQRGEELARGAAEARMAPIRRDFRERKQHEGALVEPRMGQDGIAILARPHAVVIGEEIEIDGSRRVRF